jgi:hypothetical protein
MLGQPKFKKKNLTFSAKSRLSKTRKSLFQLQQFGHSRCRYSAVSQLRGRFIFLQSASQKNSPDHMFGVPHSPHNTECATAMNLNHDPNVWEVRLKGYSDRTTPPITKCWRRYAQFRSSVYTVCVWKIHAIHALPLLLLYSQPLTLDFHLLQVKFIIVNVITLYFSPCLES